MGDHLGSPGGAHKKTIVGLCYGGVQTKQMGGELRESLDRVLNSLVQSSPPEYWPLEWGPTMKSHETAPIL